VSEKRVTYRDAGVDIEAGNSFVNMIKPLVKSTFRPEVMTDIGGFGGLFSLNSSKYKNPVLVSGTDGVGTKLKLAFMADQHDSVGIDLVAMCVNDIVVQGAEPLFFLDYLATGRLQPEKAALVVKGIAEGCRQAGCALIGGETAEMPGFYSDGEYDIAGFAVGVVERDCIIDGSGISVGNRLIGIGSSGLHSNGYSLARKLVFDCLGLSIDSLFPETGRTVAEELLTPTRIYIRSILNLLKDFKLNGIAHITGGGLLENVPRILPKGCRANINLASWERPVLFNVLQSAGNVDRDEMYRTFNMGIGMVLAVADSDADDILIRLNGLGEKAWSIGTISTCQDGSECVQLAE
jgi:phosphoribosylformylglycinamidine cyclo-ligase